MEKSIKYYWAIFEGKTIIFSGSYRECWEHLTQNFAESKIKELVKRGIKISRCN